MNKTTMIAAVAAKVNELFDEIDAMEKNLNLSANTVKTQTQLKKHEARNLLIIKTLLEGQDLEGDLMKWFESTTTLKTVRKSGGIILQDGDDIFKIQEAHPNKTYAQLKKIMADQGFHLDGHIVRK